MRVFDSEKERNVMQLSLNNIGIIRNANVELKGITVIAGKNGFGKTTLEKALFGIVSANTDFISKRKQWISESVSDLVQRSFFLARRNERTHWVDRGAISFDALSHLIEQQISNQIEKGKDSFSEKEIMELFSFDSSQNDDVIKDIVNRIQDGANRIRNSVDSFATEVVNSVFEDLFENQVMSFFDGKKSSVRFSIDGKESVVSFADGSLLDFSPDFGLISNPPVFIAPPERVHARRLAYPYSRRRSYSFSLYDLINQKRNGIIDQDYLLRRKNAINSISSIIHGVVNFDSDNGKIVYEDENYPNRQIEFCNVASGIKLFSYISILLSNGILRDGSLLIIDEPEASLHPEWQLKFTQILKVLRDELGVISIVSTHSPYVVRALEILSRDNTHINFYKMSKDNDGSVSVDDVSADLEPVYHDLYIPLEEMEDE